MAIIPSGNTQFLIQDDDTTYVLGTNSTRTATGTDSAIMAPFGFHNDKVIVKGDVSQTDDATFAVSMSGEDMVLQISATGSVLGNSGAEFTGPDARLSNFGLITSTDDVGYGVLYEGLNTEIDNLGKIVASNVSGSAIFAAGINSDITNNGRLQGAYGINVSDVKTSIELGVHSTIVATKAGIFSENTEATDRIHVENAGRITGVGSAYAIQLGDSDDTVVNHGHIAGRIYMGTGKDVFDNRGGTVDHAIEGGAGDDTLITDSASVKLKENGGSEGYDTVRSSVSYTLSANVERLILFGNANVSGKGTALGDDLFGNLGKNHLFGLGGADTLDGGKGNDLLTGGLGNDTFIFKKGYGHDTITDFDTGHDKIDVSHWTGIDDFADIKHHWSVHNGDLLITVGSDQLILQDTTKAELHASDFIFA